jgi:hypothetical protein
MKLRIRNNRVRKGTHIEYLDANGEKQIGLFTEASRASKSRIYFAASVDADTGRFTMIRRNMKKVKFLAAAPLSPKDFFEEEAKKIERIRRRYKHNCQEDQGAKYARAVPAALAGEREIEIDPRKWRIKKRKIRIRLVKKLATVIRRKELRKPKRHQVYKPDVFILPEMKTYKSPAQIEWAKEQAIKDAPIEHGLRHYDLFQCGTSVTNIWAKTPKSAIALAKKNGLIKSMKGFKALERKRN